MSIFYKSAIYSLSTTVATTTLTIDASSRAIVKEISIANTHNNTVDINYYLFKSNINTSAIFFHGKIAADTNNNAIHNTLVLEEGDSILFKANVTNVISGQISYALLNRSQQNG